MRILILGASGFLGRNIAREASKKGWHVSGTFFKHPEHIPSSCQPIPFRKVTSLKNHFDVVFLSLGNFTLSHKELIDINILNTLRIERKFSTAKIVFISSISVNGDCRGPIDEQTPFSHPNAYGLSKISGEFITKSHRRFSIIRFVNLYGRGMKQLSFIPTIINQALQKRTITLQGNGKRKNEYLHVQDAASLCIKATTVNENDTYLGAVGKSVSNLEIAKIVQKHTPCSIKFSGRELFPSVSFHPSYTSKKLRWLPKIDLEEGLRDLISFYENSNIQRHSR